MQNNSHQYPSTEVMIRLKRLIISLYFLSNVSLAIFAQIPSVLPQSSSIASTATADTHNWCSFQNPAMLGYVEQTEVAAFFDNRFMMSELSTKTAQIAIQHDLLNTGVSISHFGYSLYQELLFGATFARNFSNKFAMGIQFNYMTNYFVSSNTYRGVLLAQVGLSAQLSPNFNLSFNTFNPFQTNIQAETIEKRVPSIFSLGAQYILVENVMWRIQLDKEVSSNYRFATGMDYDVVKKMTLKIGVYGSDYLVPCLGISLKTNAVKINLNTEIHPLLGVNSSVGLNYQFLK